MPPPSLRALARPCFGIVSAVQALSVVGRDGHTLTYLCLPPESTLTQLVRVIADYGHRHPEKLHEQNVGGFAVNALAEAFPCPVFIGPPALLGPRASMRIRQWGQARGEHD